jgi:hypothetical protein
VKGVTTWGLLVGVAGVLCTLMVVQLILLSVPDCIHVAGEVQ